MIWIKQKDKKYCVWSNSRECDRYNLCCNFCKIKDCIYRCKDDCNSCKYFTDEVSDFDLNRINKSDEEKQERHAKETTKIDKKLIKSKIKLNTPNNKKVIKYKRSLI